MRDISLRSPIDFDVKLQLAEANIAIKWKEKNGWCHNEFNIQLKSSSFAIWLIEMPASFNHTGYGISIDPHKPK